MGIAVVIPYVPKLNDAFGFVHPAPTFYGLVAAMVICYMTLVQLGKFVYQRVFHEW